MKYFFLILLFWAVGFLLPILGPSLQWIVGLLTVIALSVVVYYYIDTRINTIRL